MYNVCIEMLELIPGYKPTEFRQSFFFFRFKWWDCLFAFLYTSCSMFTL